MLREPKDAGYYEFMAAPALVEIKDPKRFKEAQLKKSFHADTYCFDSKPEHELFLQYIENAGVEEIYFTGMFTAEQGDLSVAYFDPDSGRIRNYYLDFLAKMKDGTYQLIEVKGDNKIDDRVVQAKAEAAREIANATERMEYKLIPSSKIMSMNVLQS